jgi:phosphate transport system substrate-binding protein
LARIPGSIGYVEYAYAKQNKMIHTAMLNAAGVFVQPDDTAFKAAAAGADWSHSFYELLTNQPGKTTWPISGATFILMHKSQDKPEQGAEVLKFFEWSYKNGGQMAQDLDYVALPDTLVKQIHASWADIKDASGKPVWK